MIWFNQMFQLYLPWIVFFAMVFTFIRLFQWAMNKKTGAYLFGAMMQMMMPDPYAERTIEVVQQEKKTTKKEQDENGDPLKLDSSVSD